MSLNVNLQRLDRGGIALKGELPAAALDFGLHDNAIRVEHPLRYDLVVEKFDRALLVRGRMELLLDCVCVRCLREFTRSLSLTDWTCHVPLEGEDAAPVAGDCVDLTPCLREDILLAIPRHPVCVCKSGCEVLAQSLRGSSQSSGGLDNSTPASAWSELDRLKL